MHLGNRNIVSCVSCYNLKTGCESKQHNSDDDLDLCFRADHQ